MGNAEILATVDERAILVGLRGSLAHGLYIPSTDPDSIDDRDYMSVVIPDKINYFGLKEWDSKGTKEIFEGDLDIVEYEIRKFIKLLLKGNPNVVSLLWLKPDQYPLMTSTGAKLLRNRNIFMSKDMFYAFMGYANAQLTKMGKFACRGFRGQKREELITRYGYDTKNAQHCIRLLRMCAEALKEGVFKVDRAGIDAQELMEIKKGAWSQDRVIAEAKAMQAIAKEAFEKSHLPKLPDFEAAQRLCVELIEERL